MNLRDTDDFEALRKETKRLRDEAEAEAQRADLDDEQCAAFDALAIELHDLDVALFEVPFYRNNAKIRLLVDKIATATQDADKVRARLDRVKNAVTDVRKALEQAAAEVPKANTLLADAEGLIALIRPDGC